MTTHRSIPVNLRDVGGMPTDRGEIVARGVLYRGEAPQPGDGPPAEIELWPPRTVIDLRSGETGPHPLDGAATVHRLPMDSRLAPDQVTRDGTDDRTLIERYLRMLEKAAPQMPELIDIIVESEGPILVHCLAGKDRTGVVIAVLLRAVGVGRDAVLADYSRTNATLPELLARLRQAGVIMTHNPDLLAVLPEALARVLDVVETTSGTPADWLRSNGVSSRRLDLLRSRLTGS